MACINAMSHFEVCLREDILRDICVPGSMFKTNLTDITDLPAPHQDVHLSRDRAQDNIKHFVQLEKISDTLIKLIITGKLIV